MHGGHNADAGQPTRQQGGEHGCEGCICRPCDLVCLGTFSQARAETFVEHNAEFRMQLDFVVPDAALRKFLPSGWEPNIATQGPAKDCNLRMIFIDRVDITGADGAPAGIEPARLSGHPGQAERQHHGRPR